MGNKNSSDAQAQAARDRSLLPTGMTPEQEKAKKQLERRLKRAGLTESQQDLLHQLVSPMTGLEQAHLLDAAADDAQLLALAQQLEELDEAYRNGGGLPGYIRNAQDLLDKSRRGVNPLEGWRPSVPTGQLFTLGTADYEAAEARGRQELEQGGGVGFVLVAGGLGERLGYSSIKIGLPTELTTGTSYLQYYIQYIVALQRKYAKAGRFFPLCIMTSSDTNDATVALLEKNNYFVDDGFCKEQVTLVQQGKGVPALVDNHAKMAVDNGRVVTKPHGHGDVHALLYSHGVADKWRKDYGIDWLVMFQDTNGLAFHTLPLMVGVSAQHGLVMNSLAVPRKAKQAIGGIAKLDNSKTGESRTINVEYNQLDPLLRATGHNDGDVNDPKTGYSPFPGNINQLLFRLEPYAKTLQLTKGLMPEFVNPKYKDSTKTVFKKPTRLECMMQDFPTVLKGDDAKKVGFTSIAAELCFSPVKNATTDGVALQAKGTAPGTAASGEADQYQAFRLLMRSVGCQVEDAPKETYAGIAVVPGAAVVLKPDFCTSVDDYKTKFPTPDKVKISGRSTLVVQGSNVVIESLDLDGALIIDGRGYSSSSPLVVRDKVVRNDGWVRVPYKNGQQQPFDITKMCMPKEEHSSKDEILEMRGYSIRKKQTERIPGNQFCVVL